MSCLEIDPQASTVLTSLRPSGRDKKRVHISQAGWVDGKSSLTQLSHSCYNDNTARASWVRNATQLLQAPIAESFRKEWAKAPLYDDSGRTYSPKMIYPKEIIPHHERNSIYTSTVVHSSGSSTDHAYHMQTATRAVDPRITVSFIYLFVVFGRSRCLISQVYHSITCSLALSAVANLIQLIPRGRGISMHDRLWRNFRCRASL